MKASLSNQKLKQKLSSYISNRSLRFCLLYIGTFKTQAKLIRMYHSGSTLLILENNDCYTDDSQVYAARLTKQTWLNISKKLEACLGDIGTWMNANMLKLNREKTELIIFNRK